MKRREWIFAASEHDRPFSERLRSSNAKAKHPRFKASGNFACVATEFPINCSITRERQLWGESCVAASDRIVDVSFGPIVLVLNCENSRISLRRSGQIRVRSGQKIAQLVVATWLRGARKQIDHCWNADFAVSIELPERVHH